MCDYDPSIDNSYNPEFPLESDDAFDGSVKYSSLGPFAASTQLYFGIHPDLHNAEQSEYTPTPKVYTDLFCVRTYTAKDLYPIELDPNSYPAWALSFYWPVYIANFRLNSLDEAERNVQISCYFATKGLLTRMIYIRENDDEFFRVHQKKSLLLDMLVYFTSQEDAERAILCCDKTTYYGHKLNVFPGRVPEYFDPQRTARFQIPKKYSVELTETLVELGFQRRGCENIETIVKHSDSELIVEFGDVQTMSLAVIQQIKWIPSRLTEAVRKQRYLEQDLKFELMWKIKEDSSFMEMTPPQDVLQHLLSGKLPPVLREWENHTTPKDLPPKVRNWIENTRRNRKMKLVENGRKRQTEKEIGIKTTGEGKNPGKGLTKKRKKEVQREIEVFLGIPQPQCPWTRPERLKRTFRSKKEDYLLTKTELLKNDQTTTLATRNKLFYNLLKTERQLGKIVGELGNKEECEFLKNGLMEAFQKANEPHFFPDYPTDVKFSDELEPLDTLWPVYVGNFRVFDLDPKYRNRHIIEFFALKDFTVEMIYIGDNDPFYNSYLKHILLLDMLVYFKDKAVADKVVATYHSTIYRDSKLSVYPGREAAYFFCRRTRVLDLNPNPMEGEQSIERILLNIRPESLTSVARLPDKAVFFFNKMKSAKATGLNLRKLKSTIPKQRFLESDIKDDLVRRILYDPEFLNGQPQAESLKRLFVVKSMPSEPSGEVVWGGFFRQVKEVNARIGRVLDEWRKLQR